MNQEMLESTEEVSSDLAHADAFGSPEQFGEVLHHLIESEARATAFAKRKKQVKELLNSFPNTTAATLTLGNDGTASECTICQEDLSQVGKTVVQLPCHPSHLFHRDCIQPWIEKNASCPICRVGFQLPPPSNSEPSG
ncbi:hypothetical protein PTTG_29643 [Puccinia triticina 1-1 BBBD Race 1]|uniref:RING-type domain-containing protein n=1 Tax=Puccinia triticina (isolate 1-1 / race 1 (BBBD)) TaxID=630390 RepID=A0A180G2Z3_PUCT1|nr:hypothetical protein PTTG_29643 [Puccinia triticina 1-1 BBBD Race 1]